MKVIKRDGRNVSFDKEKIVNAILKAFSSVDGEISDYAKSKSKDISNYISSMNKVLSVDEIQNIVEDKLMNSSRKDVAREYILYRSMRTRNRERNSAFRKEVNKKLKADNVQNQNANVDEKSFGGRVGEASDTLLKQIALDEYVSEMTRNNHINNRIYTHDLNSFAVGSHNCLTIPFDDLLANGFNTRQVDIRPASSINTALQLVAVIFQLQSLMQFGGVSAGHLDWTLVPYLRKSFFKHYITAYIKTKPEFIEFDLENMLFDDYEDEMGIVRNRFDDWLDANKQKCLDELSLTKDDFTFNNKNKLDSILYQSALFDTINETKQAVEGMFHNLNSLQSRSGNQLPFSSINYGTCTSPEGRLIIKALIYGSIKGVGKFHSTSIFPCCIFQYMKGINDKPGTPNYDLYRLALKSTAQRLYPNYANCDWSGNIGYDINNPKTYFSTMGKRKL